MVHRQHSCIQFAAFLALSDYTSNSGKIASEFAPISKWYNNGKLSSLPLGGALFLSPPLLLFFQKRKKAKRNGQYHSITG